MKTYILYGAGAEGERVYNILGKHKISYVCDNIPKELCGTRVITFAELQRVHFGHTVLITVRKPKYIVEIANKLKAACIPFSFFEDVTKDELAQDIVKYDMMNNRSTLAYDSTLAYPILDDKVGQAGSVNENSYFWQDLWAAQHVFHQSPQVHMDIGSRIDGFIAHLLSFGQRVCLLDIRPLSCSIPGVDFVQCDATSLQGIQDESVESLSALCSLEHFGLGRYGDPIDPEACFRCFAAVQRKVASGGYVYISVPVGHEHLEFNAHRIFYASTIRECFSSMEMVEYSVVGPAGIERDVDLHMYDNDMNLGAGRFGLFMFRK